MSKEMRKLMDVAEKLNEGRSPRMRYVPFDELNPPRKKVQKKDVVSKAAIAKEIAPFLKSREGRNLKSARDDASMDKVDALLDLHFSEMMKKINNDKSEKSLENLYDVLARIK